MRSLFYILSLCSLSISASSQSFNATVAGNINVQSIQSLTLTGGTITPGFTSLQHYFEGVVLPNYITVTVKSNVSWTLSVQAQNSFFTPMSLGASSNMPAGVLSLKRNEATSFNAISPTSQTLKTGGKGGADATGNSFSIDMKFHPGFQYSGGIYTLGLMYTLSQQ